MRDVIGIRYFRSTLGILYRINYGYFLKLRFELGLVLGLGF